MRSQSRLVLVVGVVVFADTLLYAVLAPLLPELARTLSLSKLAAGILTASYPIGTVVGSVPGGLLVMRIGPRATVLVGLGLLALSSAAFGWLHPIAALDAARFVEGISGACSWAGGLAWVVTATPVAERGSLLGRVLGAAVGGALFGPVLGTLASGIGRPAAFTGFAVAIAGLVLVTQALPTPRREPTARIGLLRSLRRRDVVVAAWLVALPAIGSGAINVLGPLRMHQFGADAVAIGATYLIAAAIEAAISPLVGTVSDRHGRLLPVRLGLVLTAIALACFTLPGSALLLAVVIVVSSATLGLFWAPGMALLSDAAQQHGLHQGLAAALINLAWGTGQVVGSGAGGALAKAGGDGLPMAATAVLCVVTFAGLRVLTRARAARVAPRS